MAAKPFRINSISVPLVGRNYLSEDPALASSLMPLDTFIGSIVATGFDDVRLTTNSGVLARFNDNAYDPALTASFQPSDAEILAFASRLKAEGLTLTWLPFIGIADQITGSGTGADKANPTDFAQWFQNHKAAMVRQAQLAESVGAERFVVFTDDVQNLMYGPQNAARWLELVQAVRAVYSGELTCILYVDGTLFPGGNNHLQLIPKPVLDALDTIGVGFFPDPLTLSLNPSVAQLEAAWYQNAVGVRPVDLLRSISDFYDKKVWIGDRTFHSFDGANINHGQILQSQPPLVVDQQEQADLMESFLRVMSLEQGSWLNGVSLQNWNRFNDYSASVARFLDSPVGENFQGKLAEQVVNDWFNGRRQSTGLDRQGSPAADRLEGGYHHDTLRGLAGNDTLYGGAGNDTLDGGSGVDVVAYDGLRASYTLTRQGADLQVSNVDDGTDRLQQTERLAFADTRLAFDLDGAAGAAARVLGTAAGPAMLGNAAVVGVAIGLADAGLGIGELSQLLADTGILAALAGGPDAASIARLLAGNVLGGPPDAAIVNLLAGLLQGGAFTPASLLATAAQLDLVALRIDLVGLAAEGLPYI